MSATNDDYRILASYYFPFTVTHFVDVLTIFQNIPKAVGLNQKIPFVIDSFNGELWFVPREVKQQPKSAIITGGPGQTQNVRSVFILYADGKFSTDKEAEDKLLEASERAINRFISYVRTGTEHHSLEDWKISPSHRREYSLQKSGKEIKKVPAGASAKLTHQHIPAHPVTHQWPEWKYISDGLLSDDSPEYWRELLCLAQNRLFHDDYSTATIYEAMAFEVAFSIWALPHLTSQGKNSDEIETWHRQGWPRKLGSESQSISGTDWFSQNPTLFEAIKDRVNHTDGILDVRNSVIHQGGTATEQEAKDGYKNVRHAIFELLGK